MEWHSLCSRSQLQLFPKTFCCSVLPMRIIWLFININMRWHWSLVRLVMTVSLSLVSICFCYFCSFFCWNEHILYAYSVHNAYIKRMWYIFFAILVCSVCLGSVSLHHSCHSLNPLLISISYFNSYLIYNLSILKLLIL